MISNIEHNMNHMLYIDKDSVYINIVYNILYIYFRISSSLEVDNKEYFEYLLDEMNDVVDLPEDATRLSLNIINIDEFERILNSLLLRRYKYDKFLERNVLSNKISNSRYIEIPIHRYISSYFNTHNSTLRIGNIKYTILEESLKRYYNMQNKYINMIEEYINDNEIEDLYVNKEETVLSIKYIMEWRYVVMYILVESPNGKPLLIYNDIQKYIQRYISGIYFPLEFYDEKIYSKIILNQDSNVVLQWLIDNLDIDTFPGDLSIVPSGNDRMEEVD
ncbi:Hypothetical protein ORPV_1127 [Orpheovirus IHUMI-LCC2]|uniref:Uncharacterized protein n=1 Tax=Orpheovirus IHUMI-LCC2 TaxID=2023057 RepID=A0A2I2L689_9VIRU|nr:Hypothetical protein ORPV_1127 [Orpheovirus IHUMI-LCC2]SNW63031.1 Hypothetical protein ORPV_1127 [Orpheovirus IHUMI-LCC2]